MQTFENPLGVEYVAYCVNRKERVRPITLHVRPPCYI